MLKAKDINAICLELTNAVAALPAADDIKNFLAGFTAEIADGKRVIDHPVGQGDVRLAFAAVLWVKHRFHLGVSDGLRYLETARRVFTLLAEENRLLAAWRRDIDITIGNLLLRERSYDEAIVAYRRAAEGRKTSEARVIAILNIVRAYVSRGMFYKGLEVAFELNSEKINRAAQDQLSLLKARILLALGYEARARDLLGPLLTENELPLQAGLEARYLMIFAAGAYANGSALKQRYEDLALFLEKNHRSDISDFYRLEWMLFAPLLEGDTIKNKRHFVERAAYLARKQNEPQLLAVVRAQVLLVTEKTAATAAAPLSAALESLRQDEHHILYQYLVIAAIRWLAAQRQYKEAAAFFVSLETAHQERRSSLPQALLSILGSEPSALETCLGELRALIPAAVLGQREKMGWFLLEGRKGS